MAGAEERYDLLVAGSGFSGSILARIMARQGWRVLMLERARHPRFALGESTTPLANLSLERLSRRWGLPELFDLAAHGRWLDAFPRVGRGLKRGFSFYGHEPGRTLRPETERLLVAASPNDRVADTQWLRADVDALFARLAVEDGVELLQDTEIVGATPRDDGVEVEIRDGGSTRRIGAALLVDATGPRAAIARSMGALDGPALSTRSSIVFGHFDGVRLLDQVVEAGHPTEPGPARPEAPYPEDWAAVHHLLVEGWMYLLRFDDGLVSAGILFDGVPSLPQRGPGRAEDSLWALVERYPTLRALFEGAAPRGRLTSRGPIQHRLTASHGPRWVAMPHTFGFVDPLFSTGIAWSLRAVERIADALASRPPDHPELLSGAAFSRYGELLEAEIEQIDRLIATAYAARRRFDLFAAHSMLYFSLVSFAEANERLREPPGAFWEGLLGAGRRESERLLAEAARRVGRALEVEPAAARRETREFESWVADAIEPINVAGLADPERRNLYPVDLATLVDGAHKLDMTREAVRAAVPRLRGA